MTRSENTGGAGQAGTGEAGAGMADAGDASAARAQADQAVASRGGRRWAAADGIHIDVRGLPAPEPLVAILQLVALVEDLTPIVVHHDRDPRMLYPELAELGWRADRIDGEPGEVRLRLQRIE